MIKKVKEHIAFHYLFTGIQNGIEIYSTRIELLIFY